MSMTRSNGHGHDHGHGQGQASERTPLLASSSSSRNQHDGATQAQSQAQLTMPPISKLAPILISVWTPVFIASLDGTIVATLLSSISSSFDASNESAWLGSAYLLSVCCFTPVISRLTDILGRKQSMLFSLTCFTLGTLGCGTANSMNSLILARVVAGMGGGGLTTVTSVIMSDLVPLKNRGLLQGLTNIIFGLGSGLGGPVGGFMNDSIGWRAAFLIQLPVLGVAFILCSIFVIVEPFTPSSTSHLSAKEKFYRIDFLGSFSLVIGISSILLSLSFMSAEDMAPTSPLVLGLGITGLFSMILFFRFEKHAIQPVLPLKLLKDRTSLCSGLANFFLSMCSFAILYNFPLYFQAVRNQKAAQAGLHLIPNSVALSCGSVLAGVWMRQTGRYYKYNLFNAFLMVISGIGLTLLSNSFPEWLTYVMIAPSGFGISGVLTCTLISLINSVSREEIATATGYSYMLRYSGQVVGVSLAGVILQGVLKKELRNRITGEGSQELISQIRHQSSIISKLPPKIASEAIESYQVALFWVFVFTASMALATLICSYYIEDKLLPDFDDKKDEDGDEEDAQIESQSDWS